MTIKQQGGIFGRNPTFNNVEVDGTLTLEGGLLTNSAITVNALSSTIESTSGAELFLSRDDTAVANNNLIGGLAFKANDSTASPDPQYCGMKAYAAGSGNNPVLELYAGNGNYEARTPQLSINYLGDVTVETGNLIIGTSGKGIDFSATSGTGTSELFDDYEEGSFSPVIEGTTSAGTATYSRQAGVYTKVGNCVNFWVDIIYSSGSGSGNLKITGLPYTSSSTTMVKTYFAHTYDISLTAGNIAAATLSLNATQLLIKQLPTGGGATSSVAYDAAGEIQITGSYFV